MLDRSSGILLPVSSLPSKYGIGTFGKEAYEFVDFLVDCNQSYWQMLPIGPTGYGDSPYQSVSSYAGNPYFIDPEELVNEGFLNKSDLKGLKETNTGSVDYGYLYETRWPVLRKAYEKKNLFENEFIVFKLKNQSWLEEYALYMSVKKHFGMKSWIDWPDSEIRLRDAKAVEKYKKLLKEDINFYSFVQFLFFRQFDALKSYAHSKKIRLIGDLPIYVPLDSCDVWANPSQFELDRENLPTGVAGVPPDYFTPDGQLWGNPLYNWKKMKEDQYLWWMKRVEATSRYFDIVRIDHFRGFESYWEVPYGDKTARNGVWKKGAGMDFISVLKQKFPDVEFIAEDLGYHTPEVQKLLDDSGFPGMKVLQFGFDAREASDHAPHSYVRNSICYVGTHDNSTVMGWKNSVAQNDMKFAMEYLNISEEEEFNWAMIKAGMRSVANVFIGCMQDYIGLDDSARMNQPGTVGTNWKWRMQKKQYNAGLAKRIASVTSMYARGRKQV
ncbi:MAG: 4-alpha-glucanotransferase [Erysipelotrichaceae bacterium]|nr:4-alpha-glucanotransferase [Erysipelotrichaceae bacterium]